MLRILERSAAALRKGISGAGIFPGNFPENNPWKSREVTAKVREAEKV